MYTEGMDILAHGIWSAYIARIRNAQTPLRRKLSVRAMIGWGIFPDLFAFTIPVLMILWSSISDGGSAWQALRPHEDIPINPSVPVRLGLALYNYSHSIVIFLAVFGLVWLIRRRPVWEMSAWAIHVLIDIPTHTRAFFPTPIFWPFSHTEFSGISWASPWFMALNYGAILIVWLYIRRLERRTPR